MVNKNDHDLLVRIDERVKGLERVIYGLAVATIGLLIQAASTLFTPGGIAEGAYTLVVK